MVLSQAIKVLAHDSLDGSGLHGLQVLHQNHEVELLFVVVGHLQDVVALRDANPELEELLLSALLPLLVKSIVLYLSKNLPSLEVELILPLSSLNDGLVSDFGQLEILLLGQRNDPKFLIVVLLVVRG